MVGSGPAGGAAALLLATYGIRTLQVTKHGWLANTPRAHITNQRTMEVLRDLGVEDQALQQGSPSQLMGDTVLCTALAGQEIGRIRSWGTGPASLSEYATASPCEMIDLPQTYLEPILTTTAAARGAKVRFDTEFLHLTQDEDGVTAHLRDRVRGDTFTVRARYLIGADGSRSTIAQQVGLPMDGRMSKAGSMNIVFTADLTRHCAHRPSVLYWVLRPGAATGGIGMGLIRMVRPWNQWLLVWGYDIDQPPPTLDTEQARAIVRDLVGDPDLAVEITSTSLWTVNHAYATAYSAGRVHCIGDAVHRHPPSNGLGSNTSVQDAYNLAWKLAMVIRGQASPTLLDSYSAERAPVGRQIVERANLSRDQFAPIFDTLGVNADSDTHAITDALSSLRAGTDAGTKQRQQLDEAITLKNYEFNAHGVEMNQRYTSSAILPDTPTNQNTHGYGDGYGDGDGGGYGGEGRRHAGAAEHNWYADGNEGRQPTTPGTTDRDGHEGESAHESEGGREGRGGREGGDWELTARPTTRPGAKLPHAWLVDATGRRLSTLDTIGKGLFTVLTGLSGGIWETATSACRTELALPLRFTQIGGEGARDAYGEWSRVREIAEDGVLLVRPDGHIAWRHTTAPHDAATAQAQLLTALRHILGR
ncbi:FAD-dependent monooxygenase [Streptomyces lichenis]|uniref:FAD-dependent monooxygenase n=1 Tax=Streptomyces lichenis TaxID=2306967 RepID=A0ABT0IK43_9ACTN|nr:FAD-dependent monooxygenase [Streptomyces lichenis]